jgi:hypothetical protein
MLTDRQGSGKGKEQRVRKGAVDERKRAEGTRRERSKSNSPGWGEESGRGGGDVGECWWQGGIPQQEP